MATIKTIHKTVEICFKKGVRNAILCPGSRSAALTIAFEKHAGIKCLSISDERSAGYIALGIAQFTNQPTVIVCTSGTAALNIAPAVAEAFFQEIPLLVLTADRPKEWINQYDGQTIFQEGIYNKNCKKSYNLIADYENKDVDWFTERIFNEALDTTMLAPKGAVHINIPIREPFYPEEHEIKSLANLNPRFIEKIKTERVLQKEEWNKLINVFSSVKSIIIAVGQQTNLELKNSLSKFSKDKRILIIGDIISNVESDIKLQDLYFEKLEKSDLPDLLITTGKSFISKNLKLFFRQNRVIEHWHVQNNESIFDPFQSITKHLVVSEVKFFEQLYSKITTIELRNNPFKRIEEIEKKSISNLDDFLKVSNFSDIRFLYNFLPKVKPDTIIHIGNSLSIRYLNVLGIFFENDITFYCNRGTSGIEGTLSTALGAAISTAQIVYCILGDVSFQYDKNALWNNYLPPNLKIIILNNKGGNIFRMIDGPQKQSSFADFFETKQINTAKWIAKEFGLTYFEIDSLNEEVIDMFINQSDNPSILEIFTEPINNEIVYKGLYKIVERLV